MTDARTHTPGPWHVGMKPGPMIYGPKGEQVADLSARMVSDDETAGNAQLLKAAPDMLAALVDLRRELRASVRMDVKRHYSLMLADAAADKAIRAAMGES